MRLLGWFLALGAAAVGVCAPDMGPRVCSAGATQACLRADRRIGGDGCASNLAMPRYLIDVTAARRAGVRPNPTS